MNASLRTSRAKAAGVSAHHRPAADPDERDRRSRPIARDAWPERVAFRRRAATASLRRSTIGAGTGGGFLAAGFTLVEIMVVIVILGILATIVTTNVLGQSERARISTAEIEVKSILDQVNGYMVRNPGPVPGWEQLLQPDERGHKWIELEEPKLDPWGNEYVITQDIDYPNKPYVQSWGPDMQPDTEDDIDNKKLGRRKESQ
jgi:general secretion pathway protein G